jgi:hypothetical protein
LPLSTLENHLRQQDVVFFGGGDTEFMLKTWHETGFDNILKQLYESDCLPVMMGLSAGGIFPFESAIHLTDDHEYKLLKPGYNWISHSFCPHADAKAEGICALDVHRKHHWMSSFEAAIKSGASSPGYAVPDDCMLHFYNGQWVGAFSARRDIQYAYVTQEGIEWRSPQLLIRENSSRIANQTVRELSHTHQKTEDVEIRATQCVIH